MTFKKGFYWGLFTVHYNTSQLYFQKLNIKKILHWMLYAFSFAKKKFNQ